MKKRLLDYLRWMDKRLASPPAGVDYAREKQEHLVQIEFFMHERLIHLIVTVLFAVLTVAAILYAVAAPSIGMLLLIVALLCLLVPYIMHYYLLENGVQEMYRQYDELLRREHEQTAAKSI